ncbi:Protein SPIRRIG [Bienertia sinuspersici]
MESWVSNLLKDIKEKAGFSVSSSTNTNFSVLSQKTEVKFFPRRDTSYNYFPSRLSLPELRLLIQYFLQIRLTESHSLINVLGRLLFMEQLASENASSAPCLEFDMTKVGHACIVVSLGQRTWPPVEGYSFVCWFQYSGSIFQQRELKEKILLRFFSIRSTDNEESIGEHLYLQENGVLSFATNNGSSLSSSKFDLEEGKWYHLVVVLNKRDLAVEGFSRDVHIYLNGKLIDNGELTSTPVLVERELQITIGTPSSHSRVSGLQWKLRSCYLFRAPLSLDFINFMYMLARGHKFLLQGSNNSDSILNEDGGGERFVVLDTSSESETKSSNGSESIWDIEMLEKHWSQLCGMELICAFNATRIEALPASQTLTLLNLVDPMSSAAIQIGMPSFGYLYGDVSMCRRCIIGNVIFPVTEISVILALIERAETSNTLHIALTLFASILHQNPRSVQQMKACKGYELISLFLCRKMSWIDIRCLEILFKISVSEDPLKFKDNKTSFSSEKDISQASVREINPAEFHDELSSAEYHYSHDFSANGDTFNHDSEHAGNTATEASLISGPVSDADIVEHVLLNWTLWVTAPVSIQLEIVNFFENLISVYKYKDHNLNVLRERNIVYHLLAALHRDDVEVVVLEKFVIILTVILQHKSLESELKSVTTFVLTTFDPPEVVKPLQVIKEEISKRVTLRNFLLESLIDLQVTISSEELLEQWHKVVSSKLITFFLDDAVHPTSMIWIITLLGFCLTSSPVFSLKFENSGGYRALARVLSSFHESLDIYYIIFCLIFRKPIYPKLPEVTITDFEALMLNNEDLGDLKNVGLLDSVVAMVKSVFDQLRVPPKLTQQAVRISQASAVEHAEENADIVEELGSEEASKHKTDGSSILGLEPSATIAASVLRFMANLAKMSRSFSIICEQTEFLESCVDLYFSIMRSYMVEKLMKKPNVGTTSTILANEGDKFPSAKSATQILSLKDSSFVTASHLMLEMENRGCSGEPISVGATSTLDLISELLSAILIEHINPVAIMENVLWSIPLYLDSESVLTFQALCLSRVMIYLERRILHSDVRNGQIVDTNKLWSNLGSFCTLLVDCVYIGVFPRPSDMMRVLEFCFLMLHSAKKDGQIKESSLPWTGLLTILKGTRPVDVIYKTTNRMILYFFLPTFSASIQDDPLVSKEEMRVDICIVLELIHAHKEIIFHPCNVDTDLYYCLCINLISLFSDPRTDARSAAMGILKYLLVHCRALLEGVLIIKPDQKKPLDVLNGGFDKLLTENLSAFMKWFQSAEHDINHVLQQCARIRWSEFIAESATFRKERFGILEDRWTTKMGQKVEHASKVELVYWDHYIERRSTLAATRIAACTDLELAYGNKCESVIHAENEWRSRFEQLEHQHKVELISSLVWEDYWPL